MPNEKVTLLLVGIRTYLEQVPDTSFVNDVNLEINDILTKRPSNKRLEAFLTRIAHALKAALEYGQVPADYRAIYMQSVYNAPTNKKRDTLDHYFMKLAFLAATRSTSPHRKVGAVMVKDGHVIATGYNGVPSGEIHETELECPREALKRNGEIENGQRLEMCGEVHAEMNTIIQCAISSASLEGAVLYTTISPCLICARMLLNCKIKALKYSMPYDEKAVHLLAARVKVEVVTMTMSFFSALASL